VSERRGERNRAGSGPSPGIDRPRLIPLFGSGEDYGILLVVSDP
jgi:hypothetical protein